MSDSHPFHRLLHEISELRAQLHQKRDHQQPSSRGPVEILCTRQSIEALVRLNRQLREGLERRRFQQ